MIGAKGLRDNKAITPDEFRTYIELLKKRTASPIPCMIEDAATLEGLIDLLIISGQIKGIEGVQTADERILSFMDMYNSNLTALIMLLIHDGIIDEQKLELAVLAYHHGIRHFGNRKDITFADVAQFRRDTLKQLIEKYPEGLKHG